MKKATLENKIKVLKETISEMKEAEAHQKDIRNSAAEELQKLKKKRNRLFSRWKQIIKLSTSSKYG